MASYLGDESSCTLCIAGAGIIGLSLALEMAARGATVTVLDAGPPLVQASTAAAGMLAAADPENPLQLAPLAGLSLSLYPVFLNRIRQISGIAVPIQTTRTLQALPPHHTNTHPVLTAAELTTMVPALATGTNRFLTLTEDSLDPRQLAAALLTAVANAKVILHANRPCLAAETGANSITIQTPTGPIRAEQFVDCTGAWATSPRKGQMLYVLPPPGFSLNLALRTPDIYIVPRLTGPNAGRLLIGATIEDAGFDTAPRTADIESLRAKASALLPPLANAPIVESWAGLRPVTPDELPILGRIAPRHFIASGHYRNGILLAPGTAQILADLLTDIPPAIDLSPYAPARFR